ncbi:MAG: methanethiol S-methyltransferase [Caulobacteraceae bacterium]
MTRLVALAYGLVVYIFFLCVFLYAIGFVTDLVVPKTIDSGPVSPLGVAVIVDLVVMSVFALQHSIMARPAFKAWWTRWVPRPVERSTYVLLASLALALICWQWRPIGGAVWSVGGAASTALTILSLAGFGLVLVATLLIDHFELFGLRQVAANFQGREPPAPAFVTPSIYKVVRHPIYLGFIVAFWAAPTMTWGRLLFAAVTTAYIFVGIFFEERDLVALFGDRYRTYRASVSMIAPFWPKGGKARGRLGASG